MTTSNSIANYFLSKEKHNINNLYLNQLIYTAQGLSLSYLGVPLFSEDIEAWQCGPVVPQVYCQFSYFGQKTITKKAGQNKIGQYSLVSKKDMKFILNIVWKLYQENRGVLIDLIYEKNAPWHIAFYSDNVIILRENLQKYYKENY